MFLKEKLYLVSSAVDDSIKSASAVYDITIFKSFVEFEERVDRLPVVIDTLVLTSDDLQFTSTNMQRLVNIVQSPFMRIKSSIVYLIDETYDLAMVKHFFNESKVKSWSVYQGELGVKFIADIISGERRMTVEDQIDLVTYRMRNEEYARQERMRQEIAQEDTDNPYLTDEDRLSNIPDEEVPEDIVPEGRSDLRVIYIAGLESLERTLIVWLVGQYLGQGGKVLLMEKDVQFHRLSDIVTKAGVPYTGLDVSEIKKDCTGALRKIRSSSEKLVVVTCYDRMMYDYNFLMDILETNLRTDLSYIVRECDFEEVPFGRPYTVVVRNTVPDVLQACMAVKYAIDPVAVKFVGVSTGTLDEVGLSSMEMEGILSIVLEKNGIKTTVVKAEGIRLSERSSYDILSILAGNNIR